MSTEIATAEERTTALPALTPEGERFALRQRQARMFAMSPLVPDHLRKGTPEQAIANCWIALTLAEAMGEVPLIVMQNIHVVNGKAGFASQYMIARANSSGIFKGRIDWRIDRSDRDNLSVTAFAFLRETGQEVSVTCDMKMAKAEGWTKNAKYNTMPEVMLRYRSAAFLVRFYAPDVMLGYQTAEEVEDIAAAAAPSAPPLNAKMLIEQSRPSADERHGAAETEAETIEERAAEIEERVGEGQSADVNDEAREPAPAEEAGLNEAPHPAQAKADEIIAEINALDDKSAAIMDVNAIVNRHTLDISAMPDELAVKVEVAAQNKRDAIRAEREKGKAKEAAE